MRFFDRERQRSVELRKPQPSALPTMPSVNAGAAYRSARVGGDFFDFVQLDGTRLLFGMLDIAGRREEAMHLAAEVQTVMREHALKLLAPGTNLHEGLTQLALAVNRGIINAAKGVHNSPGFLACFDEELGTLAYINAGHTPALLSDQDGVSELAAAGVPFGLFSHAVHDAQVSVLRPGATLLIVSKGLTEARSGTKEFGFERVKQFLGSRIFRDAEAVCNDLLREVESFKNSASFWGPQVVIPGFAGSEPTDITAVAIMRPGVGMHISAKAG